MTESLPGYDDWKLALPKERAKGIEGCPGCEELGGLCDDCESALREDADDARWEALREAREEGR